MQQLSDDDYDMDSAIARVYATEQTSEQRTAAGNNPVSVFVEVVSTALIVYEAFGRSGWY